MKHDVHLYATVRVKVKGVEAESHSEAMTKAIEDTDLHQLLDDAPNAQGCDVEWAEEIQTLLVDECGDEDYTNSQYYQWTVGEANHNEFAALHPKDNLRYVRDPYKDFEIPYELDEDVRGFLGELVRRFELTYTGGCRAFYTWAQWAQVTKDASDYHRKVIPAARLVYDGGDLSYLLNTSKCDTKEQWDAYNAAVALAEEHGFLLEHQTCWCSIIFRESDYDRPV